MREVTDAPASRERFLALLRRHMAREDGVLYPVCAQLFDGERGAVTVLRGDHEALERLARNLDDVTPQKSARKEVVQELAEVLDAHISREEVVLFPFLEHLLSEEMAAKLRLRLEVAGPD